MNRLYFWSHRRFHPAWWLLVLLPLGYFLEDQAEVWNGIAAIEYGRLFIFGTAVIGLMLLAVRTKAGWSWRVTKEFRLQLPGALLTSLVPSITLLVDNDPCSWAWPPWLLTYGIGCLWMGATTFGAEFEGRTLNALLAQPISRRRLYWEKVGPLLVLEFLAVVALVTFGPADRWYGADRQFPWYLLVPPLVALATGPTMGLICRGTLPALVGMVGFPIALLWILAIGRSIPQWVAGHQETVEVINPSAMNSVSVSCLGVYLAVMAIAGYRIFARFESRGETTGRGGIGYRFSLPVDWLVRRSLTGPIGTMVRKEIRLQIIPFLMAGLTLLIGTMALTLRGVAHAVGDDQSGVGVAARDAGAWLALLGIVGAGTCLAAGVIPIAEERALGTLDVQLTMPFTVRRLWWVKGWVALSTAVCLGLLLPMGLAWLLFPYLFQFHNHEEWSLALVGLAGLGLTLVGFYASSFSRNSVKGVFASIAILAIGVGLICMIGSITSHWIESNGDKVPRFDVVIKSNPNFSQVAHGLLANSSSIRFLAFTLPSSLLTVPLILLWLKFSIHHLRGGIPSNRQILRETLQWAALATALAIVADCLVFVVLSFS
jgi:ABC-type transport system involved in multi-copper enzyme maturation permease subunit